jgi:Fe-Mn family superoxide dismutase
MPKNSGWLDGLAEDVVKNIVEEISNKKVKNEAYVVQSRNVTSKTDALSEENKKAHQELMEGYVKSLNEISARLDSVDRDSVTPNGGDFRSLKSDESYNLNAAFLHGLFFENIGDPNSKLTTDSLTFMRLERDWGTFDKWQKDFIACCLAARNGWAVTCYNTFLKRYMNVVVGLHSQDVPFGCIPLIVVDCWEHSYYRDFLKDRKSYVFEMMKEFRWDKIEERFEMAEQIGRVAK